jgi:hypothetical protein
LSRFQAAIAAGVDPTALVEGINKAKAQRDAVRAELASQPRATVLDPAEVYAMIDPLGDIGAVIHQAEPDSLAKLYRDLRLQVNYRHSADGGKATATIGVVTSVSEGDSDTNPSHPCARQGFMRPTLPMVWQTEFGEIETTGGIRRICARDRPSHQVLPCHFDYPDSSVADRAGNCSLRQACAGRRSAYELPIRLDHQTRSVCDDALVSVADHQTLRVLEGRYVLQRAVSDVEVARDGEVLAVVRGPDGGACMRRQDAADDAWVALWNGDEAHPPDATGMLAAIVAPLAAGNVPVWVAASFDGDIVLIPVDQVDEASELLRRAGHRVIG